MHNSKGLVTYLNDLDRATTSLVLIRRLHGGKTQSDHEIEGLVLIQKNDEWTKVDNFMIYVIHA